ncbi:BTB/POZ protein [Rhizophagus irregularis DAOM 181602=DAOM 197198]|nr:BTB/POZ protein [Rhizophagus irregularis DAOM 181602=DAOM 197198]
MAFENDSFLDLQKFCTELIAKHPEKIFSSSNFTSIPEKALISLIQHDNHQMGEVQVWEHVLKWGIAKNPGLSSDPSSYSNDDFNVLKNDLQHFIPLIKFTEFTSREFLNEVYPYKKIIPDEMCENLVKYFLDHDYVPRKKSEPQIIKELNTKENIENHIISRVKNEKYAICNWFNYGPSFGNEDLTLYEGFQSEVSFKNKKSRCCKSSYDKQIRKTEEEFSVDEYEVFQIINDN